MGAASWLIEEKVQRAQLTNPGPTEMPHNWLFVPELARSDVLQWGHSSKLTCHLGPARTLCFLQQQFWWPSVQQDTTSFVVASLVCAPGKLSKRLPPDLLNLLLITCHPWSHIAVDFVTGLTSSNGNTAILTFPRPYTSSHYWNFLPRLRQVMPRCVFHLNGFPWDIISERGPQFTSQVWKAFCTALSATVSLSSGYRPQ